MTSKCCKICAFIWTYNPAPRLLEEVVKTVSENVDYVLIVDNGSKNPEVIEKYRSDKVNILRLTQNLGVEAINVGLDILTTQNACKWILLLDDDSIIIQPNAVMEVLRRYEELPEEVKQKIGVISISDLESIPLTLKRWLKHISSTNAFIVHHDAIIFSGAIIRTDVVIKHNLRVKKELFLDHADTEFFTRMRRFGYLTVLYTKPLLKHRLGIPLAKPIDLMFYKIKSTTQPHRLYYITRNATYLLRKGITPVQWFLSIIRFAIPLILQSPKVTIKVIAIGFVHGILGKLGKWDIDMLKQ